MYLIQQFLTLVNPFTKHYLINTVHVRYIYCVFCNKNADNVLKPGKPPIKHLDKPTGNNNVTITKTRVCGNVLCCRYRRMRQQSLHEWSNVYWRCELVHLWLRRWLHGNWLRDRFVLNTDVNSFTVLFDDVQKQLVEAHCPHDIMLYLSNLILGDYRDMWINLHDYRLYAASCPRLQSDSVIFKICELDEGLHCLYVAKYLKNPCEFSHNQI